jgi:hypothetical protein
VSREELLGVWRLLAFEPFGESVSGQIIYHPDGRMSVHILRRDRPAFAAQGLGNATPEEAKVALDGYIGYFGRYTVDEEVATVTHHVEGSITPSTIGEELVRHYEVSGDRLTLRVAGDPSAGGGSGIVWERVS